VQYAQVNACCSAFTDLERLVGVRLETVALIMNRRKAIGRIILTGIGGGLIFSGYEWFRYHKKPDYAFAANNLELITALADTIIPSTPDSPGAREAAVGPVILHLIKDCTDKPSANKFIAGLQDVDDQCRHRYGRPFQQLNEDDRIATLTHFEQRDRPYPGIAEKVHSRLLGTSFFSTLKNCTVIAYCTSEQGATKGLSYVLVPGSYHGCIPKLPGQKGWATK
jgi:hypothetical protein